MRAAIFTALATLISGTALAQQANVNLDYNPQKNTENLIPFSAPLNSPDVRDDRTVTFRVKAPEARSVMLVGPAILVALGQERPVPFQKGADGVWALTVGPSLDLFGSFGVLSAGDPDAETSLAGFLNDPAVNRKVDYLFIGQGTVEASGRFGERVAALRAALLKHDVMHEYYVGGHGGHDWSTWRHLLHEKFLPGLWRK